MAPPGREPARQRWRPSILLVLMLGFGGLTMAASGTVTLIGYDLARRNTYDLIAIAARSTASERQTSIRATLDPAENAVRYLAGALERGELDPQSARMPQLMEGMITAAPQLGMVAFIQPDLTLIGAGRILSGLQAGRRSVRLWPELRLMLRFGESQNGLDWHGITYVPSLRESFIIASWSVKRDDRYLGLAIAGVPLSALSNAIVPDPQAGNVDFVLRGPGEILAHPSLAGGARGLSSEHPIPTTGEVGDTVLDAFEHGQGTPLGEALSSGGLQGGNVTVDNGSFVILYQLITGYDDVAWRVGRYFPASRATAILNRLTYALLAGAVVLGVTLLFALVLSRIMSRGIGRLAAAAQRIARLDFEGAHPLPGSMLAELDRAVHAFNSMRAGLAWFNTYVPRALVKRLMRMGDAVELAPVERELTVVFTDIVGFTPISQRLSPPRLAAFLNRHFGMLAAAIESEHGTVDKYIGDSVMAFWGAPAEDPDHALHACRAALAIGASIKADNDRRRRKQLNPVRLRIGVNTGTAIAGNIGAPGRVNYTLIGDAVNTAQRIEQAGHGVDDGADTIILVSAATAAKLPPEIKRTEIGAHMLKGLTGERVLYRLILPE
ncbi:adenylate/guanylate cyclase domain-containing protein [Hypericibacter sp.]|uniref:adenylate/guanylate cyclase domain-containing protein n=1 Tax=Hypericibacter sp. TaxID=2705401 RepID=UPI003D6CF2F3